MLYQPRIYKRCPDCDQFLPAIKQHFRPHEKGTYGLFTYCKPCEVKRRKVNYDLHREERLASRRRYYKANADKERAYTRKYHKDNKQIERLKQQAYRSTAEYRQYQRDRYAANPEKFRRLRKEGRLRHIDREKAYRKESYRRNPQKERENTKRWRQANPDRVKAAVAHWFKNNPEKRKVYDQRKREKRQKAEGVFTHEDVRRQFKIQSGRCYWCSELIKGVYHVDHIIPLSRGGTNWPSNLAISCPECNYDKGNRLPYVEWEPRNPLKL